MSAALDAPPGYERIAVRGAEGVALREAADDVRTAVRTHPTLHAWAGAQAGATAFAGRTTAWGVRLPASARDVVVRHAMHGGLLAPLTGDRFRWPGRAPMELAIAERLRTLGVPTPRIVGYLVYPAGPGLCRTDVATEWLRTGGDLPAVWRTAEPSARKAMLAALGSTLRQLASAGARHADLNVKNLHLAPQDGEWRVHLLDVDRVRFGVPGDPEVMARNVARLERSLRKARAQHGLDVPDSAIAELRRLAEVA